MTKPENKITLVESNQKKCYFLRTVIHKLELKNTTVINKTITKNNTLGEYDVITARAFASITKIIELTKSNTHKKSRYVLLKGRESTTLEELKFLNTKKHQYEIIKLNNKNHERSVVVIKENE